MVFSSPTFKHDLEIADSETSHVGHSTPCHPFLPPPTRRRPSPNLWSFVCLDELQEAVLFPYLLSRPKPAVAGEVEAEGVEAPLPDLTTGDWLDPATNAAREATAEVILAQTEEAGRDRELEKDMFQAALVHRVRQRVACLGAWWLALLPA